MLSALLDIEIGLGELLTALLVVGAGYLVWQWWSAQKVAASGVAPGAGLTLAPMPLVNGSGAASSPSSDKGLPMTIFFGSQSGTAETFALELAGEARQFGFKPVVTDLQDYDVDHLGARDTFVVFLMATFGEGDPTDNAADFYKWLHEADREPDCMAGLQFSVFGLGNRQYEHFCSIGINVDKRLGELGGTRVVAHGEGDDDGSLEDDFSSWKSNFWAATKLLFRGQLPETAGSVLSFKPSFVMEVKPEAVAARYTGGLSPAICDPKHKPILAAVVENRELRTDVPAGAATNAAGESTRHIELDMSALRFSYVTADNLGVCPRNDAALVSALAARLKQSESTVFSLKALGKRKAPVPSPCSVKDALTWYLDFQALPRASLLTILAQYTEDEAEKAKLHAWTHEQKEEFHREERSILEVLEELPGLAVPFLDFLEFCPKLQPRFYTISSSSLVQPKQVAITVAKSTHQKTRGRVYHGLATTYLCALKPGAQVCVFLRSSNFRLPKPKRTFVNGSPTSAAPAAASSSNASVAPAPSPSPSGAVLPPIIMVGPGTGVAPFRAFVQEFGYLRAKNLPAFPSTHLFFGCRNRKEDFIYQDEFGAAVADGSLSHLHTAFSRETPQKVYVQTDLKSHAETVWQLLSVDRAYFYVCGGTLMGRQVKECIQHIVEQHGNLSPQAAQEYVKKLQTEGRYIQELWS